MSFKRGGLLFATIVLLTDCSGGLPAQPGIASRAGAPGGVAARPDRGRSWMASDARTQNLLYVSDGYLSDVYVYTYPAGKLEGTLTGFEGPGGLCVDKAGNVFVTDFGDYDIIEYAHGGTKPIATISDTGYFPQGCAVDDATGDLAVSNFCAAEVNACVGPGSVAIYKNASGTPIDITDPYIAYVFYCGYDARGNLFVDGQSGDEGGSFGLTELPQGRTSFEEISLNRVVSWPGGVQWDGKYLAVGDGEAGGKFASSVHQVVIKGKRGTVVSSTRMADADGVEQFWIQGSTLVAPNAEMPFSQSNVLFYSYPKGGSPSATITGDFKVPAGATVSLAQ